MTPITYTKPSPTTQPIGSVDRAGLVQDDLSVYELDLLKDMRVAAGAALPASPDSTTLGISAGSFGTNSPMLESSSTNNTSDSEFARGSFKLPVEYVAGQTITLRMRARVTATRDTSATLDAILYKGDEEGGIGSDLITPGAQSINSTSFADIDFVVDPSGLVAGDTLDFEVTLITDDGSGGSGAGHGQIGSIQFLLDVKG